MRTTRRLLIVAVVLALPLWIAGTASGGPDCTNPKFADNPSCTTTTPPDTTTLPPGDHPPGMSCAEAGADPRMVWSPNPAGEVLEGVTLTPGAPLLCIDLLNDVPGTLEIAVTDPGRAGSLAASIRDSHPGDFCIDPPGSFAIVLRKGETQLAIPGIIPAATLNACGTEYSEAEFDGDGNLVSQTWDQDASVADPLVFSISYGNSGPTTVEMDVAFTPASPTP